MPFKNETHSWDDLRLFLAVASEGGLANAVSRSGVSAPTLSRRISHLENTFSMILFDRHPGGVTLTPQGRELLEKVQQMDLHNQAIQSWRTRQDPRPLVRVTVGYWTSIYLTRNLDRLFTSAQSPRIELLSGSQFLNLSRREADIAIRNKQPDQKGLKRRRIGPVTFAIFGSPTYCASHPQSYSEERYAACDWVIPSQSGATGGSSSWLRRKIGETARLVCDTPQAVLEAAAAGGGLCILPCFIGVNESRLVQVSDPLASLPHEQWLVTHENSSALPHVRHTANAIATLMKQQQVGIDTAN
ncbi:LysR family transcriptional regulator [Parasedimentitalea maritima]|uniref:LysR family transcriptional regulator n=1 Tax=Parasedimentitalea maritima TaxID=2578117 RepID=A0A6A4RJG2_9RHOB|nr:LysR family transcriptional regulator [Zongyanglinia marina]KAE9629558.1 LysR family transcriptional regulator [Zongyanglinia marina]